MAKAYIYIYKGFPASKARKYYVCKYGKGSPVTYQVVPQLQRTFDREGVGDKETVAWKRYKKLRRNGYLYTRAREKNRCPMYGAIGAGKLPEAWRPVGAWFADELQPGEVDWRAFGASLREAMQRHPAVPEIIAEIWEELETLSGEEVLEVWRGLAARHFDRGWPHLWATGTLGELEAASNRLWTVDELWRALAEDGEGGEREGDAEDDVGDLEASRFPLWRLRQCVGPTLEETSLEEAGLLEACLGEAFPEEKDREPEGATGWAVLLESLPEPERRYEDLGAAGAVPREALYDIQWVIADRFADDGAAHPRAATGRPGLHARFHAGATAAAVVRVESLVPQEGRARLEDRFETPGDGGAFSGWSEAGRRALVELVTRGGELPVGAPTTEMVAEWCAGGLDAEIGRQLLTDRPGDVDWEYSRDGHQLVVSTRGEVGAEAVMAARRLVIGAAEALGYPVDVEATRTWRAGTRPLRLGELIVPEQLEGPVRVDETLVKQGEAAARRVREGDADDSDRALLERLYAMTGDLRWGTWTSALMQRNAEALMGALTLSDFVADALAGWQGLD